MKKEKNSKITKKMKNIRVGNTNEDTNEVKAFIIIIVIIAILVCVIYGLTELFKKNPNVENNVTTGSIDYNKVSVGTILNRPYNEYYVLAYSSEDSKAVLYSTLLTKYMQESESKDYVKIYYCDLSNSLNKNYYNKNNNGTSNSSPKSIDEFNFGNLTLIKVKNGKINKYIEDYNVIKELLK